MIRDEQETWVDVGYSVVQSQVRTVETRTNDVPAKLKKINHAIRESIDKM